MIWLTWRQFRTQAWIAAGGMAVLGALRIVAGRELAALYAESGIATCQRDCDALVTTFLQRTDGLSHQGRPPWWWAPLSAWRSAPTGREPYARGPSWRRPAAPEPGRSFSPRWPSPGRSCAPGRQRARSCAPGLQRSRSCAPGRQRW